MELMVLPILTWIALLNITRFVGQLLITATNSAALLVNEIKLAQEKHFSVVFFATLVGNVRGIALPVARVARS